MFDREAAAAEIAAEEGLSPKLARMCVDEDPAVQARNINELKAALGVNQENDAAKAAAVAKLREDYQAARVRRDVQAMVSIKHTLAHKYQVFQV